MKPLNLQAFYEDEHIIVCFKPPRFATECCKIGSPDMVSLVKNHLSQTKNTSGEPYLSVIHRLDQPVSGILVFAKTPFAAKNLNRQLTHNGFGKYYRALVDGIPAESEGTLENYLVKDGRTNISRVCTKDTPGEKYARLHYKILKRGHPIFNWGRGIFKNAPSPTEPAELDIRLDTGRHHQIRVQLAAAGCPIIGDTKYNPNFSDKARQTEQKEWQDIRLCAYKLEFRHPKTNKPMHFEISEA